MFDFDRRASNGRRHVDTWLPVHSLTTAEVWRVIDRSGVPHHPAYDAGMPRPIDCTDKLSGPPAGRAWKTVSTLSRAA